MSRRPSAYAIEPIKAFYIFLVANLIAAAYAPIQDCDETFNYWEPTHYLSHGYGLQTWEYSPDYAIRSWLYVALHAAVGSFRRLLPRSTKVRRSSHMLCCHSKKVANHHDLGRRVLLCSLRPRLCLRPVPGPPLPGLQHDAQCPNRPLLHDCDRHESRQLSRRGRIPALQLRHVHGHAGCCLIYELAWWSPDLARRLLVCRRWYPGLAVCCCPVRALHAGGGLLCLLQRQVCLD